MNGKRIVGEGSNKLGLDPYLRRKYGYFSLHAEVAAIQNANQIGDTLIVTRVMKNGQLTCAKPCDKCMKYLKDKKIKKVYYTNWSGEIESLKIS